MRLVCPNCEAKYEVPDDAIPDTGRDVQCTNCNHTWFQMRGRTAALPPVATPPVAPVTEAAPMADAAPTAAPVEAGAVAEAGHASAAVSESDPPADAVFAATNDSMPVEAEALPAVTEEGVDPEAFSATADETVPAADAEEAVGGAFETDTELTVEAMSGGEAAPPGDPVGAAEPVDLAAAEVGAATAYAVEPQAADSGDEIDTGTLAAGADPVPDALSGADLPPEADAPAPPPEYAVDESVLAILREEAEREANARRAEALESQTDLGLGAAGAVKAAAAVEAKPAARRDLLPDVEEINSTLRPSEMQDEADGGPDFVAPPPEAPRGFRSGFLTLMTVAILAAALYVVAPRLAVTVPALSGPLEAYVAMIDSLRLGLDGMMRSATVAISDG